MYTWLLSISKRSTAYQALYNIVFIAVGGNSKPVAGCNARNQVSTLLAANIFYGEPTSNSN